MSKPYKNMTGGLFEDRPLEYVGKPRDTRIETLERIATMSSKLGEMRGKEMLAISVGHGMGIVPTIEFIEDVKSQCTTAYKFACDCANLKTEENRQTAYKSTLKSQCQGIMARLVKRWGTSKPGKEN